MKIHIKATQIELTESISSYVQEKIGALAKFVERWDAEGAIEVWCEVGRTTRHHHKGDVFRAEADMRLPGAVLRAEDADGDLRVAVDRVRDKLEQEIRKYRETHLR
jgi:putative sigma-54 modulation protein